MRLRIGLGVNPVLSWQRGALRGITQYALEQGSWVFRGPLEHRPDVLILEAWRPHGIIGFLQDPEVHAAVRELGKPAVNVGYDVNATPFPAVLVDDAEIGRLAAEHLMERQFSQFAFFLPHVPDDSITRRALGFAQAVQAQGFVVHEEPPRRAGIETHWREFDRAIIDWVKHLPKPIGVMAATDWGAWHLSEICRQAGVGIPSELAIVGVGNDEVLCNLVNPTLSSVVIPEAQMGYQAAALLDRCLQGKPLPAGPIVLKPEGVVARGSSEMAATAGPDVLRAMGYIRANAHLPISVDDVVDQLAVSRRCLERQFRKSLGRTILSEIRRAHVDRARSLLIRTELPVSVVAQRSGLADARWMAKVFDQHIGMTPSRYRRQHHNPTRDSSAQSATIAAL